LFNTVFYVIINFNRSFVVRTSTPHKELPVSKLEAGVVKWFADGRGKMFGRFISEKGDEVFFRTSDHCFVDFYPRHGERYIRFSSESPDGRPFDRIPERYDEVLFERRDGNQGPYACRWCFRDELMRVEKMLDMDVMASLETGNRLEPEIPNWLARTPVPKRHVD
jgi:hypothetical protein